MKRVVLGAVVVSAVSLFGIAFATPPDLQPALAAQAEYARAEQAFQAGDLTRSSQLYSKILEGDSAQPFAWFRLGLAHHQLKNFRQALHAYDSAISYAQTTIDVPDLQETIAKTRFNRAMLLLDAAGEDLRLIPANVLARELEVTRSDVHEHVSAALQSARSRVQLDPVSKQHTRLRARAYVYTAPSPEAAKRPSPSAKGEQPSAP